MIINAHGISTSSSGSQVRGRLRRRHTLLIVCGFVLMLLVGAVVLLTVTNGFDNVTTQQVTGGGAQVVRVRLVDTDFGFDAAPDVISVDPGTHLVLNVVNDGNEKHDLASSGGPLRTRMLEPGESQRLDLGTITQNVQAWCTLPGHKFLGMMLEIRVTGAPPKSSGS